MIKLSRSQTLQLITTICQKNGCQLKQVDVDQHRVELDGPPDAQEKCRRELEAFLN